MTSNVSGLHNKFRPASLARCLGNEQAVSQLNGYIQSGKFPSAILFTGPPGSGKTTLARAFASDVLGGENLAENLCEINFGADRTKEDVLALVSVAKLRPAHGALRRFILGDELQSLIGNKPAADAFLKPLEEPVKTTTFLLCSMEPEKFSGSVTGRALASRCVNIQLKGPSDSDMRKQAVRILKGEGMLGYVLEEAIAKVVEVSNSNLRVLANNIESIQGYYGGLTTKPESLPLDAIESALELSGTNEDIIAARFMASVYAKKYVAAHRELLNVGDSFGFINKCIWLNWFVLNQIVLKEARHPKVWGSSSSYGMWKMAKEVFAEVSRDNQLTITSEVQAALVQLKLGSGSFAVDEKIALSNTAYLLVQRLKSLTGV